jgi:hypothetical protein
VEAMAGWRSLKLRDGLAGATITSSGSATGFSTGPYRYGQVFTYMHSSAGTTPVIRFNFQIGPNMYTGAPPALHANQRWTTLVNGATYTSGSTGLRTMAIAEGQIVEFGKIGWVVSGTNPRIRASVWASFKE